MTVLPDKHTFTIWQGATFFEVLTLYESNDTTSPRDFCTLTTVNGLTVSTNANSTTATLSSTSGLIAGEVYSISSATIPAVNNIYFEAPNPLSTTITLSSSNGVTTSSSPQAATIKRRTLGYAAEMLIRNKPQGTVLHALRTENHPNYNSTIAGAGPVPNSLIVLPVEPDALGQIKLVIDDSVTKTFGSSVSWKTGVYDLTITNTSESPNVTDALLYGGIKVNGV
jgi:hypothetical protein